MHPSLVLQLLKITVVPIQTLATHDPNLLHRATLNTGRTTNPDDRHNSHYLAGCLSIFGDSPSSTSFEQAPIRLAPIGKLRAGFNTLRRLLALCSSQACNSPCTVIATKFSTLVALMRSAGVTSDATSPPCSTLFTTGLPTCSGLSQGDVHSRDRSAGSRQQPQEKYYSSKRHFCQPPFAAKQNRRRADACFVSFFLFLTIFQ